MKITEWIVTKQSVMVVTRVINQHWNKELIVLILFRSDHITVTLDLLPVLVGG